MGNTEVTLGVQAGDVASADATRPAYMSLRKKINAYCKSSYSSTIKEFVMIFRISGSLWWFEGEGAQRLRLNRKGKYVTGDFVVPETRWKGVSQKEIRIYLAEGARELLYAMADKLVKAKIDMDAVRFKKDVDTAIEAFYNDESISD